MLALADEPAIQMRMHPISVETYHWLGEVGQLGERTELIRGIIIDQMPKSELHSWIVLRLDRHLLQRLPEGFLSRPEQPLTFLDSEPEPDIAVIRGHSEDYGGGQPRSAELVMEVCVTTEDLDRIKLGVYAEAGIPECWLVLAESRTLERHTEPLGGVYRQVERASFPATLKSTIFPALELFPVRLFPT